MELVAELVACKDFVRNYLLVSSFSNTTIFLLLNLIQKEKNVDFGQTAYKIGSNNLCIRFGTGKVRRLNQSHSKDAPKTKFPAGLGEKNG